MKFYCENAKCTAPNHEYDETEFAQYMENLSESEKEEYFASHWCPSCYEQAHHILISTGIEDEEQVSQLSPVF